MSSPPDSSLVRQTPHRPVPRLIGQTRSTTEARRRLSVVPTVHEFTGNEVCSTLSGCGHAPFTGNEVSSRRKFDTRCLRSSPSGPYWVSLRCAPSVHRECRTPRLPRRVPGRFHRKRGVSRSPTAASVDRFTGNTVSAGVRNLTGYAVLTECRPSHRKPGVVPYPSGVPYPVGGFRDRPPLFGDDCSPETWCV